MKTVQHITIPESCPICGDEMVLYTEAGQDDNEGQGWSYCAIEDDTVQCPDCGAIGFITIDDETASVNLDEETEHNLTCRKLYEARR